MSFLQPYIDMWKNYVNFSGRTSVRGFWMAILVNVLASIVVGILAMIPVVGTIIYYVYMLAIIVPSISLVVRRLHDAGKCGWWYLLVLTGIGSIVILVFCCMGSVADNQWGPAPQA